MENLNLQDLNRKPMTVPLSAERKIFVLGNEITIKLASRETEEGSYVFEQLTPPGVGVPRHIHQREDEIIEVIEGEYEVFFDGKIYMATQRTVMNFPRFVAHGFKNVGEKPARARFTVTPGANFEEFFEEMSALPRDEPPDMAKVSEICSRYGLQLFD
jgi:oxalate decarboxylase/phosphoglucose isomerase-like protein (cupin superfamily)